jgi:DNA-binding IclR family transcriptional regulator
MSTILEDASPSAPSGEEGLPSLTSVGKALAILDAFDGADPFLGVSDIARRAGLPKSTAFRLLLSLAEQGYVERRGVQYCLGTHLFELGNQVSWCRPRNLRETALPYMCELQNLTNRTVHLAVLDGCEVLYIEKVQGHKPVAAPTRVGGRVPARNTALGKAILAYSPDSAVERVLAANAVPRTRYSIASPRVFREELAEIRRSGYAFDREESKLGLTCVAAPILRSGEALAAISISGTVGDFDPDRIARRVRATADAIAAKLR